MTDFVRNFRKVHDFPSVGYGFIPPFFNSGKLVLEQIRRHNTRNVLNLRTKRDVTARQGADFGKNVHQEHTSILQDTHSLPIIFPKSAPMAYSMGDCGWKCSQSPHPETKIQTLGRSKLGFLRAKSSLSPHLSLQK